MIGYIERRMVYKPASHETSWQEPPPDLGARDVWLPLPAGGTIHAWWCVPQGWEPGQGAIHYSHGNAGNLSHRAEGVRRWLTLLKRAVLIYDYPGYGRSTGKPSEAGCYGAAEAALTWLVQEAGISAGQVVLHGGSLGCALSVEMATRHPNRALVLVSPFTSVPDMAHKRFPWLPVRRFLRNRFDNLAKMPQCPGRVFIAHGTADGYVPCRMGEALFAVAREPKQFFPMIDYDHHHSPGPDFYSAVESFLAETTS